MYRYEDDVLNGDLVQVHDGIIAFACIVEKEDPKRRRQYLHEAHCVLIPKHQIRSISVATKFDETAGCLVQNGAHVSVDGHKGGAKCFHVKAIVDEIWSVIGPLGKYDDNKP